MGLGLRFGQIQGITQNKDLKTLRLQSFFQKIAYFYLLQNHYFLTPVAEFFSINYLFYSPRKFFLATLASSLLELRNIQIIYQVYYNQSQMLASWN